MDSSPHFPAAKILLALPPLTSTAVTGPGISEPMPMAAQVELMRSNWATLTGAPAPIVSDPPTTKYSWLFYG